MKTTRILALGILLFSTAMVPTLRAADEATDHSGHEGDSMMSGLEKKTGADFEAAFLAMMIHHHQGGMKMAMLVESRGESADLKKMAKEMIETQRKEIVKMTMWLKDWHQKAPDSHQEPPSATKMMEQTMAKLKAAEGANFDRQFAMEMAKHHQGGIAMAELAVERAEHKEAKELAGQIVKMQTKERADLLKIGGEEDAAVDAKKE